MDGPRPILCGKNAPQAVNFVHARKNYPASTKSTLSGAPFPTTDGKLLFFCHSIARQSPPNKKKHRKLQKQ
jgi:hypothetical protein